MKKKLISFIISSFILLTSTSAISGSFSVGKKVLAPYGGKLVEAEIISGPNKRGEFRIHFDKTDSSRDKWLSPKELQDADAMQKTNSSLKFKAGDIVDVSRDLKMWYEGTIKELKYCKYIVAVNGYQGTSEYSENELRVKAEVNMSGKPNIGDKVEYLSSNGSFIKGIVKEINDGKYTIQTGNYDNVSVEAKNLNSVAKQQEIALQKIQDEYYKTFWTDVSKYSESVKYVASAYNPDYSGTYIHASFTPEMIKKISSDLDALDKLCKSKYPDLENPTYLTASQKYDLAYLGGDWRKMAEKRKDIIQKSVLIFVEEKTKSILNNKQGANDEYYVALKDGFNTIKKDVEKTLKELKIEESMKSVGLSFKPDWNDYKKDYDKKLAKFNEDLKSRPPVFADDLGNSYSLKDSSVEAAAKKEALSQVTNGAVIQSGVKSSNWQVEKNKLGIPTYMTKYGGVMLSSKDYRSCIIVNTGVYKDYTGGGTYGAPYAKAVTTKYVRCK
ncbi:MAG: hypothetical protein AABZ74_06060 [Cyanobacteriota bacterium]